MNHKSRIANHKMLLIAAAAVVLVMGSPALTLAQQAPQLAPNDQSVVVTMGTSVIQAAPDRAWVSITAESRASNPRDAQSRNAQAMRPVMDKLRGAGIPADAIKTIAYDLQQEWDFVENRRVSKGYVARNTIEVRLDAVERVGEILESAVGSGATSVGGIRFDLKDRAKYEREALRLAVSDARARAEAAAAGAGRSVDRIIRIDEQGMASPPVVMRSFDARIASAQAAEPPISAGQIELRAQVTLTSLLK